MQRLVNDPTKYVDEMLEGVYLSAPDMLTYVNNDMRCLVSKYKKQGKVALATGGGSGHLPLFLGYVGKGLLDGCGVGGVFQSPSPDQILEITKEIDSGAGVLYIYGNYGGDIMNFGMAKDLAEMEDIEVREVVAGEDVLSSPKGQEDKRRGVAGIFYVYKIAGAAAEAMLPIDEVERLAIKATQNVRTVGMALTPCIIPEKGEANFSLPDGKMEIGMGIHGEPGIKLEDLKSADEIVEQMMESLLQDLPYTSGDEVSVLINGLGATPKEELYIVYRKVAKILEANGIKIFNNYIGEFATSMDMAGMSISLFKLDDELKTYLKAPYETPFIMQNQL
ncbi:dihydroxyacetone kinase subunit DhaK [Anaerobiospirillum thomasii]|uniref:PTS-dependent dihydroxyacetone kinase, dihydroxyacetone-binding subunit dhaK n=1 Tax=Anaerobiospirillum thomasii TaxID=179995 RepID=A0A2X0WUD7_9GAMM|nr:dihydroxyacetone kinase subunit DhaK [Anaerobiospirillum thomasii]SPT69071.1 PTS-dependent dihydroxyacetone kinase, dihydroxyacetone-binding subunit dhaK [Anaerobiospirillum thomasii]